jgi:HAD superfamily hydrolase (TIGR01509 family)
VIAVGFDFDHTLGIDNGLERKAVMAVMAESGVDVDPDDVKVRIESWLHEFRAGNTDALVRPLVDFITARGGHFGAQDGADTLERFRYHALALVPDLVQPLPGALELLAALHDRGIPAAVLTNGWSPLQEQKLAKFGFTGRVLVSGTIGCEKPEPAAFEELARELATPLAHCWYVGDTPLVDVVGARDAGMHGVWFDWEGHRWPPGVPAPEARIERLADFLDLIPGSGTAAENLR